MWPSQKISNGVKKAVAFFAILFLLFGLGVFAQRELEIQYPTVPGATTPTTVEGTQLPDYVKYLFNFAIIIAGAVAFGVIVWGGVRWLTSAGDPSKLKDAKDQIFAAFLGLIILLSSYLILTTINPQLAIFEVSEIETAEVPPATSPTEDVSPDPLVRIKELSQTIDGVSLELKNKVGELKSEMEKCKCGNSDSECYCQGLSCTAIRCFGDPCPNREEIKIKQREVIAKSDEILYYKNRLESEREDLAPELEHFELLGRLTKEQEDDLMGNIDALLLLLQKIGDLSANFALLPEDCLPDHCLSHCLEETCHHVCPDGSTGCHPLKCTGGNPCPPFDKKAQEIIDLQAEISQICQNIINILK